MLAGAATGIGSLPGTDLQSAAELVLTHLPDFPHVPELPARGPWFDMVGRGCGLLTELPAHFEAGRWSFDRSGRPGRDLRRAQAGVSEDLERMAEIVDRALAQGSYQQDHRVSALKVQACGPVTLACSVELPNGQAAVSDPVAVVDVAASLAEGLGQYVDRASRLFPDWFDIVLQLDEPALTAALTGAVPTSSGLAKHPAMTPQNVTQCLTTALESALERDCDVVLHSCASEVPVDLLSTLGLAGISLDITLLSLDTPSARDLSQWLDQGNVLLAGVELSPPEATVGGYEEPSKSNLESTLGQLMGLDWLYANASKQLVITPRCGLAAGSRANAGKQYRHACELQQALHSEARSD